jgi:hypothetical protein
MQGRYPLAQRRAPLPGRYQPAQNPASDLAKAVPLLHSCPQFTSFPMPHSKHLSLPSKRCILRNRYLCIPSPPQVSTFQEEST